MRHKHAAKMGFIFCPFCYEGAQARVCRRGHLGDHLCAPRRKRSLVLHKPTANGSSGASLKSTTCLGTWLAPFPSIWEFLTLSTWTDGSPRIPGTILLFMDEGSLKVCLKDKNGPRTAFVTGPDPDTLFLAVEEGLAANSLSWRPDKSSGRH